MKDIIIICLIIIIIFETTYILFTKALNKAKGITVKIETAKLIVFFCLLNGFIWVYLSYFLAFLGRGEIAESLSQTALVEIIASILGYFLKSLFENLSKNNAWPDKPDKNT